MRILSVVGLLALAACGGAQDDAKSGEESVAIGGSTFKSNEKEGTATIETPEGSITTAEGAAAANTSFPSYLPKYPGSVVTGSVITRKRDEKARVMASLVTDASFSDVAEFYKGQLAADGWKLDMNMVSDAGVMLSASKGSEKALVAASDGQEADAGKRAITLTFATE